MFWNAKYILNLKTVEFSLYVDYSRKLEFDEQPDYNYLRNLFYSVINKHEFQFDNMFDWIKSENISYSVEVF